MMNAISAVILPSSDPISSAAKNQFWLFALYAVVLFVSFLLTILLFRSGNSLQEAIKADADARIKGADERIRQVDSDAKVRVKQIEDTAATAKRESDEKLASLNKETERIKADAGEAKQESDEKIAGLTTEAAKANRETEQLRKDNLELEASLSPRQFKDQSGAAAKLRRFAGATVVLSYIPDTEAKRTAELIAWVLSNAGWKVAAFPYTAEQSEDIRDGIGVGVWEQLDRVAPSGDAAIEEMRRRMEDVRAAGAPKQALLDIFDSEKLGVNRSSPAFSRLESSRPDEKSRMGFPPNEPISINAGTLIIEVGIKPSPAAQRSSADAANQVGVRFMNNRMLLPSRRR